MALDRALPIRPAMTNEEAWSRYVESLVDEEKEQRRRLVAETIDLEAPPVEDPAEGREKAAFRRNLRLARERVGDSNEDRARWLLRFASLEVAKLSAGDWLNLEWEILVFSTPPPAERVQLVIDPATFEVEPVGVSTLLSWVQEGLLGLKRVKESFEIEPTPRAWSIKANVSYQLTWVDGRLVDSSRAAGVSTADHFQAQVYNVLVSQASRFRLCQNCGQPFIARRRQSYCARGCSQAVRTQKYRAKNPEKVNRWRVAAYEKQVKAVHPNAKVRHRARTDAPSTPK